MNGTTDSYSGAVAHILRWRGGLLLWMLATFSGVLHAADPVQLTDIEFSTLSNDRMQIQLHFDGPPPEPQGYSVEQPARIAIDLVGVKSALERKQHKLDSSNARNVTVVEAQDRTRLIVKLVDLVPYETTRSDRTMTLVLGSRAQTAVASAPKPAVSQPRSATTALTRISVQDIDFRRGEAGAGRLMVQLSAPGTSVDVAEQSGKIRVRFGSARLPETLQRRLDVSDFATPVSTIDAFQQDNAVVLEITPDGRYEYLAYQTDREFTLDVKPLTAEDEADPSQQRFAYTGEKLSLNFQDIEVRSVLQLIADFTDLNLVASDTVTGRITLRLKNVPWDQALDLVLKTKGLDKRLIGNVLMVAPAAEIAAREKLELETSRQVAELAPLTTEFIEVNYAKASDILGLLSGKQSILSSRGSATVDTRTNLLIVQDTADKIVEIRRMLRTLDIPVRQVLIEARIVRANTSASEELGIQWGGSYDANSSDGFNLGGGPVSGGVVSPGAVVDLGVTGSGASSIAFGISTSSRILNLQLSALEDMGESETVAQPKVLTADGQTALIESGTEIPYQEATSSGATSTSFKSAVLGLRVTPQITPDGRIMMDLQVNQDEQGAETSDGIPVIDTTRINTQVLVDDGETVVLGGIFTSVETSTETKTPFLGDIPYVGRLFKRTVDTNEKTELLIFITPRLVSEELSLR
ncbi:MAG: type IV pilus secretin PilQ [Pseudomonadota bacterium]|nr:type IV pilus secretin PilQ [Pseudomonadota bacterium]